MKRYRLLPLLALPVCLVLASGPAPASGQESASPPESCVQLLKSRCLSCHYESRICRKLKNKAGRRAWNGTIGAMIRHGAQVNKEERKRLAACLAAGDREVLEFCGQD